MLTGCLLEITERPEELDEHRLERELGRFMAHHLTPGTPHGLQMSTDLFRIICDHGLAIPPEAAAVFRVLATLEGSLTRMAPGFDIITEARRHAASAGITAVLLLGLRGGPAITQAVGLYQFLGYCLLVTAGILALRVLVMIFRSSRR